MYRYIIVNINVDVKYIKMTKNKKDDTVVSTKVAISVLPKAYKLKKN